MQFLLWQAMAWSNIRKNRFPVFIFSFLFFLAVIFIQQKRRENEIMISRFEKAKSTVPPEIFESIKKLREKLLTLEFENNVRTQELLTLRRKLKENFSENVTDGNSLSLPSIFNYLPHLLNYKDALTPVSRISQDRKGVTLAFGIPTVRREKNSYLPQTLQSLISGLSRREKKDVLIIVYIGEQNEESIQEIMSLIRDRFPDALNEGYLEVIAPPRNYYPNLDNLRSTFGDPKERVKWRAKQNLDYAFLMMYAQSRAIFYVQMEDDLIAVPSYASTIKSFAVQQSTNQWFMLEFSALGFIGKLFHSYDISILVEFFLMFYKEKPNDWLLDHVLWVRVCNPEKSNKDCDREKSKLRIKFKPSLFQHIGKESSLKGKKQDLVDKDFKKQPLFQAHLNPKCDIITNMEEYQTFTAFRGYLGHSFFWALTPIKNSFIRMHFHEAQIVKSFLFRSGNVEHPGDILVNATVELLTVESENTHRNMFDFDSQSKNPYDDSDYITVGSFNRNGVANGKVPDNVGLASEIRIRTLTAVKDNWVIISEFFIEVEK